MKISVAAHGTRFFLPHHSAMVKKRTNNKPEGVEKAQTYIKEWRRFRSRMTQEQLAERIGMATASISQIENDIQDWTGETILSIAWALNVTVPDLFTNPLEDKAAEATAKLRMLASEGNPDTTALITRMIDSEFDRLR